MFYCVKCRRKQYVTVTACAPTATGRVTQCRGVCKKCGTKTSCFYRLGDPRIPQPESRPAPSKTVKNNMVGVPLKSRERLAKAYSKCGRCEALVQRTGARCLNPAACRVGGSTRFCSSHKRARSRRTTTTKP